MMHGRSLCVVLLACSPALAQRLSATDREAASESCPQFAGGSNEPAGEFSFYGGDLDERFGFTSERNTSVPESWTFDDFDWHGGAVYACLREGQFGTLMGQFTDLPVTTAPTGRYGLGYVEVRMDVDLTDRLSSLPPGTYHIGIRPVGTGVGHAWVSTTSGLNAHGSPIANGNTYLQSDFFGFPLPTDWQNWIGAGPWDVSYGVESGGGTWGYYMLTVSGTCPGRMTISWGGAPPDKRQAILYSSGTGHAPIGGPCRGMASGLASIHVYYPAFWTGSGCGSVHGTVRPQGCGKFIQLAALSESHYPCELSRVVQLH